MACDDRDCRDGIYADMNRRFWATVFTLGTIAGFLLLLIISNSSDVGRCASEDSVKALATKNSERWQTIERFMGEINAKIGNIETSVARSELNGKDRDAEIHDLDKRVNAIEHDLRKK